MDGRDIQGSNLHELCPHLKNAPDARGVFIRGMNENRDTQTGDSNGNQVVGRFQNDVTKMPNNKFVANKGGAHEHHLKNYKSALISGHAHKNGCEISSAHNYNTVHTTKHDGHEHNIRGGDAETRPKNIALYTYIKID